MNSLRASNVEALIDEVRTVSTRSQKVLKGRLAEPTEIVSDYSGLFQRESPPSSSVHNVSVDYLDVATSGKRDDVHII